jgi:arylsulfatase
MILIIAIGLIVVATDVASAQECINREILPIVPPEPATYSELDTKNTEPPARFEVKAPKDAPNVIIFGSSPN